MKIVKPHFLLRSIYASLVWKVNTLDKVIYLTFDDGPIPEVTPWILDQLQTYNAKATFFCVGENVVKHPEIFNQIKLKQHGVGHHTFNHLNGWKTGNSTYFDNVEKGNEVAASNLFRPPYGKIKRSQILDLKKKYKLVMWDVLAYDFDKKTSPEKCLKNVLKNTQPGSIVVFHDSEKAKANLYSTLPKVLEHFSAKGYTFNSLQQ